MLTIAQSENVYCKLSGMVTEADPQHWRYEDLLPYIDTVVESFGINRVMYGSDWPVCEVAAEYASQLQVCQRYFNSYPAKHQEAFFGLNAKRFYNLKARS
jgi:L-fuconolactonase